jgi:HEAT repeat protein
LRCLALVSLAILSFCEVAHGGSNDSRAAEIARLFADMVNDLHSPDLQVRKQAVMDLDAAASKMFTAVRSLDQALKDPNAEVRAKSARTLADIGVLREAVPGLIAALRDVSKEVRVEAAMALGNIGPVTTEVVPALTQALNDPDLEVAIKAMAALGMIKRAAKPAVPDLVKMLKTKGNDPKDQLRLGLRYQAAISLGDIGPEARAAIPELLAILMGDENHDLQCCVLPSLGKIGASEEVLPILVRVLKDDKRRYLRPAAAHALGWLGPDAKHAVPDLATALDTSEINDPQEARRIREAVLNALSLMGADAGSAAPAVAKLLEDRSLEAPIRATAESTLQAIRPKGR